MQNVSIRIFREQLDLINQLPKKERAFVLYNVINDVFNQFDNQNENQNDLSNLGKVVYKILQKNIILKEFSNNYGGKRKGAGRPISAKNNQIKNQIENQNENAYISVSVSDINNNNNSRKDIFSISTTRETPTQDEILEYAKQQNDLAGVGGFAVSQEQAQDFYDYYAGIGWCLPNDAKTPIVDWKPFLRKWVRNPRFKSSNTDAPDINDLNNFKI